MPGYYIHFASACEEARRNKSFLIGLEAPDIFTKWCKLYGLGGAFEKYIELKTTDMPVFEEFIPRVKQKELQRDEKANLHFGPSSCPNIDLFMHEYMNTKERENNPFWRGYLWHLLTDYAVYKKTDIDGKFMLLLQIQEEDEIWFKQMWDSEVERLHKEWDITNAKIRDEYPDVVLTPEVQELGVVKFIEDEEKTKYVDWEVLRDVINYLRSLDPFEEDLDQLILRITDY